MRNLKRALSLGLAAVMVMGMMIVGTSAKSYTDSDKIENQVAVEVLGEIGAMVGNEDGSFAPDRVVTRAEMAVLLTRILYGNNLNVDQFKGLNTFTDVPDWAEGFINLCASLGIVAGRGDGIFDPNATVTTAEASLMLSRALGYFKNPAEFGGDWALAAVKRATQANIIGGDMVLQANAGLTRDDVAQMTFNTLTKAVPVQYNELLDVYYNENQGIIYALEFNYLQTLGYTNFGLVYKTDESTIYGRPATTWGIGSYNADGQGTASGIEKAQLTDEGGLIASRVRMLDKDQIITVANTPDYVYSDATDEKDVYADLGATVCNGTKDADYTWTVYKNGEEQNLTEDEMIPSKSSTDTYEPTGKGSVTEIYIDDYDQTVTVVEINYYLGQVSKVNEDDKTITVKELSTEPKLDDDTFATTEFAEDDYVVFTVDYNDEDDFYICELMAPETVTGDVSRVEYNANDKANDNNNNYIRLDGEDTKYYYTAASHLCYDVSEDGKDVHPNLNEEYILYMTPAGYVLGFAPTEVTVDQYLYVKDSDEELQDWVGRVVLPDATNPKIDLKDSLKETAGNIEYVDETTGEAKTLSDNYGSDIRWVVNKDDVNQDNRTNIDNRVWKYSVNDSGVYTLTWVKNVFLGEKDKDGAGQYVGDFTAQIKNGKSYISEGNNNLIVDQKTIFVDTMNDVAYTGYDAVPNVDNALLACVVNDDLVADIVFILEGDIYDVNATYFVLADTHRDSAKDGDAGNYWIYENAYVDGQKTELNITYEAVTDLASAQPAAVDGNNELKEGVLYKATKTIQDGEFISALEAISDENSAAIDAAYFGKVSKNYDNNGNIIGEAVGDNAFWITNAQNKTVKFDTDNDTVYVTVRRLVDLKGNVEYVVDDGKISDLKMIEPDNKYTYSDKQVHVVKRVDDNTARLVYIFWTETEKGDPIAMNFTGIANAAVTVNGTSVYGNTTVNKHADIAVEITAAPGYTLTSVSLNGVSQTIDANGKCAFTIKDITTAQDITVETKAIVAAKGDVILNSNNTIDVTYTGGAANKPALDQAIKAIEDELTAQGYTDVKVTKTGANAYTFTCKDSYGYDTTFTWNTVSGLYEIITINLNGADKTIAAGTTLQKLATGEGLIGFITVNGAYVASGSYSTTVLAAGDDVVSGLSSISGTNGTVYGEPGQKIGEKASKALAGTCLNDGTPVADVVFPRVGTDDNKTTTDNYFQVTKSGSDDRIKPIKAGAKVSSGGFNLQGDYVLVDGTMMAIADAKNVEVAADMTLADNYYVLTVTDDTDDPVLGDDSIAWSDEVVVDNGKYYAQKDAVVTLTLTTVDFTVDGTDCKLDVKAAGSGTANLSKVDFDKGSLGTFVTVSSSELTFGASEKYSSGVIEVELTVSSTAANNGVVLTWKS